MKQNFYKRKTCRLCLGRNIKTVLELTPIPLPDEYVPKSKLKLKQRVYPLNVVLCNSCGNVQLSHVVNPKIIYRNYIYETVSSLGLIDHFQKYAEDVITRVKPITGSLVVDIGSNDGTLLKTFTHYGMRVVGIDPAKGIAQVATAGGIPTIPEFFTPTVANKITKKYGKASIITVNNLFANIDNLDEFMSGVNNLLSPTGVLVIESYYLPDLIKNMVFDFIYHEHLTSFTANTLTKFFARHGMQLYDAVHVPTKGGSMRYYVQLNNGLRKSTKDLAKFINLEKKLRIHKPILYKRFETQINTAKNNVLKVLTTLQKKKKLIAGYGASATSTTLIYHFKLGDKLEYLIDDYPRKQNTYSPGKHIPVYSSEEIERRKPDAIVNLAWRYTKPILTKNKKYLSDGGIFIIPLPKLQIISGKN